MISIGTWNVEYARPKRLDAIRTILNEARADIWVLTETHDDLAPNGCGNCAHSDQRPTEGPFIRTGSRWVSIWSCFPIVPSPQFELADPERTTFALIQVRRDKQVMVYGTVMPWKGDRGTFDWSEHHKVIPQQCAEWRRAQKLFPTADLIVAGDYNTDMVTGSYYGTKAGILSLKAGLDVCDLFCATEFARVPTGALLYPPIDHIALPTKYRGSTSVIAAWDANRRLFSDHSGLVVEVADL